ncbi:MAG: GntG family PLP-dependent aldolase [Planctomycetota bacterium]
MVNWTGSFRYVPCRRSTVPPPYRANAVKRSHIETPDNPILPRRPIAMTTNPIDLRSDTVTTPTEAMRHAIADAAVGDCVIDVDPTVETLERETAALLGKPAAAFMPSGSMTNQIAIRVHCDRGTEFLCEADAHIYHYEQAAFAQLSGLVAHTVAGDGGVLSVDHVEGQIRPRNDHMVNTTLLCLENTHNRWGGRITPLENIDSLTRWAHEHGLKTHLDGARLWNAAAATGVNMARWCRDFDSISVCFSKGLGAPVGSVLAGEADFIQECIRTRKLFGGGMRQAGIIAAGALHALRHHRDRLQEDHEHATQLADAIRECPAFSLRGGRVDTNIVIFEVDPQWSDAESVRAALERNGVRCFAIGPQAIRLVTHLDVDAQQIQVACDVLRHLGQASGREQLEQRVLAV